MKCSRIFEHVLFVLLLGAAGTMTPAVSQSPTSGTGTPSEKKPSAHIRVRVMLFNDKQSISVSLPQDGAGPRSLLALPGTERPVTTSYEEIPIDSDNLAVKVGETPLPTQTTLVEDVYYTLLIYPKAGKIVSKLLQDTFSPDSEKLCRMRIFNLGSERTTMLTLGGGKEIPVGPNTFHELDLQQAGSVPIEVRVLDPAGGHPARSLIAINTGATPACSIVIVPDYRGKFRPRVWNDGPQE